MPELCRYARPWATSFAVLTNALRAVLLPHRSEERKTPLLMAPVNVPRSQYSICGTGPSQMISGFIHVRKATLLKGGRTMLALSPL